MRVLPPAELSLLGVSVSRARGGAVPLPDPDEATLRVARAGGGEIIRRVPDLNARGVPSAWR